LFCSRVKTFDTIVTVVLFQSLIKRIPGYLTIQFVRFFYKEKESVNAKILKVGNYNTVW